MPAFVRAFFVVFSTQSPQSFHAAFAKGDVKSKEGRAQRLQRFLIRPAGLAFSWHENLNETLLKRLQLH